VCNSYFCAGLEQFMRNFEERGTGARVVATMGGGTRRSPLISR